LKQQNRKNINKTLQVCFYRSHLEYRLSQASN
jgi:hypothetical protein